MADRRAMLRASFKPDDRGCNCGRTAPALEHALTCPVKMEFIMGLPEPRHRALRYGYTEPIRMPDPADVDLVGCSGCEMMRCNCGQWFPRWQYYRCPGCQAGH